MSKARDVGKQIGKALGLIRFIPSTPNFEALVRLPAFLFQEYTVDGERMYERGEVLRMPGDLVSKYLLQGDGRIDPSNPPPTNSLCKLFRNNGRFDWVREEYCIKDFERYYDDGSERKGWYRVTAANAGDNNTPPPNAPQVWEKL